MTLPSMDKYDKASEVVVHVMELVKTTPGKFEVLMTVLQGFMWLEDTVEYVETRYKVLRDRKVNNQSTCSYYAKGI
jgi:hypothetical protein